ncbi:serine carboxypeptidase-like isoform X1 [Physcomitrium patens]|uniref:Carboxypeptidase n=2 Tax=Physcomitrium patens TaxID=3218 RepID=A9T194_PHYPA|nr:serine carboxypeptidase-like [Physcomitrium patens]PNR26617.1 hypothetical protein PHYPA_030098 [Physcomitrium patens]|eukprot:XP_024366882.1 serine carboxypeptidase-like [Physcomitrella patens]
MSFSVGSGRVLSYVLVVAVICGVSTGRIHPEFATSSVDPQGQAQRLIKALNLFPDVLSVSDGEEVFDGAKLQERRLNLDVGGDAGVSTEELGQYAGYFKLARTHAAKMFYFFFESRGNKTDDPVVLWMTGGPGCASELALFYENGPFKITDNLILVWNDFGWDKVSSIIFVDQPVGTGFSYSTDIRDIRHDEEGVSEDMYDFFQAFYEAHPEFVKNKLFVTGESYAGHYVPAVAGRLHRALKHKEGVPIDLKGFAIGNGLTQPDIQYEAYGDYALEMNLITEEEHQKLGKLYLACAAALKFCGPKGTIGCVAASFVCQSIFTSILGIAGNINYYDVRKECQSSLCYDFSNLDKFLNNATTKEALGVGNRKFVACSPLVYFAMIVDVMKNLEKGIPGLLEDGIELLVYAGEYDLICNWLGNSRWVTAMDWSGQVEYAKAGWKSFEVDGEEAGLTTGYGPLQFLKVHNAGHMVPMDQPKNSLEMLYRWTRGISLGGNSFDATIVKEIRRNGNKYTKSA